MKRTLPIALVTALALFLVALPAFAHEPGSTYEITAVKATSAPVLDGILDEQVWVKAALNNSVAAGLVNHPGTTLPKGQTIVFAAWDEEALYLAYTNYRDMSKVTMFEDGIVSFGAEEENELFWDWEHSHTTLSRIQFAWDAYGAKYATAGFSTEGMEVATNHTAQGWVAEVKLPWANLQVDAPEEGQLFGLNFTGYTTQDAMYIGWAPTYGSFDNPPLFGGLVLGPAL